MHQPLPASSRKNTRLIPTLRRYASIVTVSLFIFGSGASAQITVADGLTAQQLVQELVGDNVVITNPVLNCPNLHSGTFNTVSSNLGLPGGIVLCSGYVKTSGSQIGVNSPAINGIGAAGSFAGDPQMSAICGQNTFNACTLQFDFTPDIDTTSTLHFKYVFGSEEYPGFTCSPYNDAFGFILNGPGYNNTNIALVPGTTIPVAVNSINSGTPSSGYPLSNCTNMGPGSPFPAYFVPNATGTTVTFDGFTTVLEAKAVVEPCTTYHIKLGVADASDAALQSGVFLQRNSFSIDTVSLNLNGILASDNGYLVEGCTPAQITASRSQPSARTKKICLSYGGTATNGVDYPMLPDSLVIQPYSTSASLLLDPIQDNLPELPYETVIIRRLNCCSKTVIDSVVIKLRDSLYVNLQSVDTGVCQGESVRLQVSGDTSFHYSWTPTTNVLSPTDSSTTARPDTTTTYVVTASFKSCPDVKRSFTATVEPIPIVDIVTPDQIICLAQPLLLQANVGPAWFTNYSYSWSPGTYLTDSNIKQPYFFTQLNQDNRYQLTVKTPLGCVGTDTLHIFTHPPLVMYDISPDQVLRYGDSVRIQALGAYYYTWTPTTYVSEPNTYNPFVYPVEPTVFTVVGMNEYGCRDTAYVKVGIDYTTYQFVPSAFTPNGDGLNDVFRMGNMKYLRLQEFRVFNRWGQQVFSTEDPKAGWDGKFNGVDQPTGVYGYIIKVAIPDGSTRFYKGDVTLMR